MEGFDFNIDLEKLPEYEIQAKDFCAINGLVAISDDPQSIADHGLLYPLPVTLLPTKFPRKQFEFAMSLQTHVNELVHKISNDHEFLKETLKDVIKVDDFTRNLWHIYESVRSEGVAQPLSIAILRNDFMLDKNKEGLEVSLSQIEINTVSISFGASTTQMTKLHRNMLHYTNNQHFIPKTVDNDNLEILAKGIVESWRLYNNDEAYVVFIVSETERNIGDQRLLENACYSLDPNIRMKRLTFGQIHKNSKLSETEKRLIYNQTEEIAVVYYRCGYTHSDYKDQDWETRLLIERSFAIKLPNIQTHLAGSKKIQQILCSGPVLDRFVKNRSIADRLRSTFVDQYSFEEQYFDETVKFMLKNCQNFVLKPQREGGGNNIYKEDIKTFYSSLVDKKDLLGYILMRLVEPFVTHNYIVKANQTIFEKKELISELGIFGVVISRGETLLKNMTGGYLVRTKSKDVNEGGVATGYAALDSLYLV